MNVEGTQTVLGKGEGRLCVYVVCCALLQFTELHDQLIN